MESTINKKYILLTLILAAYLGWKLYDYLNLMISSRYMFFSIPYFEALLNVPIYLSSIFLLTKVKVGFRQFWKVAFIIAMLDQAFQTIIYFPTDPFLYWAWDQVRIAPLYAMGWFYAFKAGYIWGAVNNKDGVGEYEL